MKKFLEYKLLFLLPEYVSENHNMVLLTPELTCQFVFRQTSLAFLPLARSSKFKSLLSMHLDDVALFPEMSRYIVSSHGHYLILVRSVTVYSRHCVLSVIFDIP